jgi:hypothetical protein
VAARQVPPGHLALLRRLQIEGEVLSGADPVPLVARHVGRCFTGRLPLDFAQHLLEDWETAWWTAGRLARLRVLLCDQAFEAGLEVRNLLDAGQTAPALGAVLNVESPAGLAALRLLWSLRPTRPWDRFAEAETVFEVAADPGREGLLRQHPDLLLWQEGPWVVEREGGRQPRGPARIAFSARGVWLQDVCFTSPPAEVEVRWRGSGSEVRLGGHLFRGPGDLEDLVRRMERWFRYGLQDFLPQVPGVQAWRSPQREAILRAWGAVPCPACRRYVLPRVGQVGIALEDDKVTR